MDLKKVLKDFMSQRAPSGYEREMAYSMKEYFNLYADEVFIDRVGNTVAKINGTDSDSPVIMVYAHMDQLGFIVRKIEADGFLQLDRLGGVPEKVLPGLNISIRTQKGDYIQGVIGTKSHHATPADEKYKVEPITSLFVDIGAASAEEVRKMGIDIGCPAIYKPYFEELCGNKVSGTSIDNRGGCAILVYIASALSKNRPRSTVYLVGTVWEEFNLRGAMMAARHLKPDIAICLDVVLAGDTPDLKSKYETKVGAGPAVTLYTFHGRGTLNGALPHNGLVELAVKVSEEDQINLQRFASLGILTDSSYLQLENEGAASIDLGFPTRYTHTPIEMCDLSDLEHLGQLVCGMIKRMNADFNLNRY